MANTATQLNPLNMQNGLSRAITPIVVSFDTINSDLTIYTPDKAQKMVAVVGMAASNTTASNLTVKSGSTTLVTLQLAANQGIYHPIGKPIFVTQPGQALVMQVSAQPFTALIYVVQGDNFAFNC